MQYFRGGGENLKNGGKRKTILFVEEKKNSKNFSRVHILNQMNAVMSNN